MGQRFDDTLRYNQQRWATAELVIDGSAFTTERPVLVIGRRGGPRVISWIWWNQKRYPRVVIVPGELSVALGYGTLETKSDGTFVYDEWSRRLSGHMDDAFLGQQLAYIDVDAEGPAAIQRGAWAQTPDNSDRYELTVGAVRLVLQLGDEVARPN